MLFPNSGIDTFTSIGMVVSQLASVGVAGKVVARLSSCVYLEVQSPNSDTPISSTQLICVGLCRLGRSPITLQFSNQTNFLPETLQVDTPVFLGSDGLTIKDKWFISFIHADVFEKRITPRDIQWDELNSLVNKLSAMDLPEDGLARLMSAIEVTCPTEIADEGLDEFVKQAFMGATEIADAMLEPNHADMHSQLCIQNYWKKLIGAGPGLTPSGDDVLCGLLTALHVMSKPTQALNLWFSIKAHAAASTTPVSLAMLEQVANGRVSEHVAELVELALSNHCTENLIARAASRIGHTSGWDWLAGLVIGLVRLQENTQDNGIVNGNRAQDTHSAL